MRSLFRLFSKRLHSGSIKPVSSTVRRTVSGLAIPVAMFSGVVTKPAALGPVPEDAGALSHHVKNRHGETVKFKNPHASFQPLSFWELAKVTLFGKLIGSPKWPKPTGKEMTVVEPVLLDSRMDSGTASLRATWLGHACYYVEFPCGLRVLFDPVFDDCCAPINMASLKRFSKPACAIRDLPFVDAVVISHSHYDHLSYPSVKEIQKHHPEAHFFVGLGLEKWFKESGVENVTEMDWWQDSDLSLTLKKASPASDDGSSSGEEKPIQARISCLPCQHSSGRRPLDRDQTLWCSWAVSSGGKSVWFGGDTGYRTVPKMPEGEDDYGPAYASLPRSPQFAQIGELRGPFDLGLIPIGAYAPRHLFSCVHANPFDAVEIFRDVSCRRAMAIHWGTWVLTPEEVTEPPRMLRAALRRRDLPEEGAFDVCNVGESREF
ncbi:beta-lactamase superfamily domain-containing protein [Xylariales sp. PMI_506]|nr:beta-lactamase superfamily domain-containing protein [Xylariales sp. PMI_506]